MTWDPAGPVAILAGSGALPALVVDHLGREGRAYRVLAFRGFAESSLRSRADAVVDLLDVKRASACLADWKPSAVTLAGGVQRPGPSALLNAFSLIRNSPELAKLAERGDDNLLRGVVRFIEENGHRVVGVHDIAPQLLAEPGVLGSVQPELEDREAIALGLRLLADLSRYDVGQGVVVAGERILAVEGPEGTDRMLARAGGLSQRWLFATKQPRGVLVKAPKAVQDRRFDLPAIGPRTFVEAGKAGLRGIAVASGATLVLDREESIATADRLGLFLIGVDEAASRAGAP